MRRLTPIVIAISASMFTQSCLWNAPADDAGDEVWVQMAIPTLLGRKPRNSEEVRVLVDYAGEHGRDVVARMIMNQPEFATYWAQVLAEDLKPDRTHGGTHDSDCWERPMLEPHRWSDLVTHMAHSEPTTRLCYRETPSVVKAEIILKSEPGWDGIHGQQADGRGGTPHLDDGPIVEEPLRETTPSSDADEPVTGDEWAEEDERVTDDSPGNSGDAGPPDQEVGGPPLREDQTGGGPPEDEARSDDADLDVEVDMSQLSFDPERLARPGVGAPETGAFEYDEVEDIDRRTLPSEPLLDYVYDEVTPGNGKANNDQWEANVQVLNCYPFNMADAVLAAVTEDDLFGVYRANLGPLSTFHGGFEESQYRRSMSDKMLDTYFNRDRSCMTCHTTNWSTTDARPNNGAWDRFEHPSWDLEGAAFSYTDGGTFKYGGNGGTDVDERFRNYFRTDQHPSADGYNPFGLADSCTTDAVRGYAGWDENGVGPDTISNNRAGIGQHEISDQYAVTDLAEYLRVGMMGLDVIEVEDPPWDSVGGGLDSPWPTGGYIYQQFEMYSTCVGCHSGTYVVGSDPMVMGPDLSEIVPRMSNERLYDVIKNGWGGMPAQTQMSDTQVLSTIHYMRQDLGWYEPVPLVADGDEALALFLAHTVVDNIVEEAMGGRFTIQHGHYRNLDQKQLHHYLVMGFLEDGWSLQRVLLDLVTSEAFSRKAPADSALTYDLQMLAYPWAEEPPYESQPQPDGDANSAGDHVYRYSLQNLYHSFAQAMHWPTPRTFGGSTFPTTSSLQEAGRRGSPSIPPVDEVTLSTLLGWEKSLTRSELFLDACEKPSVYDVDVPYLVNPPATGLVVTGTEYDDWIDIASAQADGVETVEDVVIALKDRMITDPTIDPVEGPMLELLVGANLTDTWNDATMQYGLRQLCGVLTKSPQFMLGGLSHPTPLPATVPAFIPCSDDLCTYDQLDLYYEDFLCSSGASWEYCQLDPLLEVE